MDVKKSEPKRLLVLIFAPVHGKGIIVDLSWVVYNLSVRPITSSYRSWPWSPGLLKGSCVGDCKVGGSACGVPVLPGAVRARLFVLPRGTPATVNKEGFDCINALK